MKFATINDALIHIQNTLKAPKGQWNAFSKFNYRSCEDILVAVKPLLKEVSASIKISDELIMVGERYYIKATVILTSEHGAMTTSALAREPLEKKGMDASQITGTASSYARKYALNGMFAIDDSKDSDVPTDTKESALITDDQALELESLITDNDIPVDRVKRWMKAAVKVENFTELNEVGYKHVVDMVNKQIKAKS